MSKRDVLNLNARNLNFEQSACKVDTLRLCLRIVGCEESVETPTRRKYVIEDRIERLHYMRRRSSWLSPARQSCRWRVMGPVRSEATVWSSPISVKRSSRQDGVSFLVESLTNSVTLSKGRSTQPFPWWTRYGRYQKEITLNSK